MKDVVDRKEERMKTKAVVPRIMALNGIALLAAVPAMAVETSGVLSVDGRLLARQKMEHTIPFLMSLDESLDIGMDTRTAVDDSYKLPFKFTGTINKVTYNIGRGKSSCRSKMSGMSRHGKRLAVVCRW